MEGNRHARTGRSLVVQHAPAPRILVVDDSPTDLALMATALQGAGLAVLTAMDGEAAYQMAMREHPDCVVLDVVLPGRDGFALCRRLKQSPGTRDIPIILISVKDTPLDRRWGLQQGADDYLGKPFTMEVLLASVRRAL